VVFRGVVLISGSPWLSPLDVALRLAASHKE